MPLDHILERAVVINWSDLIRSRIPGFDHELRRHPSGTVLRRALACLGHSHM